MSEVDRKLGREILSQVDITLISFMKQRGLKPNNKGEFFELLKVLDTDTYIYESLVAHMIRIEPSITEYYRYYSDDRINLVIKNII